MTSPTQNVSIGPPIGCPVLPSAISTVEQRDVESSRLTTRVLHVINGEHFSGAERVQDLLAMQLPRLGVEVGFACLKPDAFPSARQSDVPIFETPMTGRLDFSAAKRLADVIDEGDYEIVHAHTPRTVMIARSACRRSKTPLVYHVHSPTCRDTTSWVRNSCLAWAERLSLRGGVPLICVSHSLADHMTLLGYAEDQITVVPNGVPRCNPPVIRQRPTDDWVLGTVALFRGRKGTEAMIDALAALREAGLPVRMRAVGPFETPEYEASLKQRVARHGLEDAVDWVGFTRDVNAELKKMDLFVLPSLFGEGLPMVVLEAMAAALPVVGTRVEGVPEAVRDGQEGVLAQPGNAEDLAAAIRRIIDGDLDWRQLSDNAVARHAERFSDEAMAAGVAEVYRRALR
jgi:glycosyltransferase involved in cell wall biosynthesis